MKTNSGTQLAAAISIRPPNRPFQVQISGEGKTGNFDHSQINHLHVEILGRGQRVWRAHEPTHLFSA
jgi:hypothetical protein